MASKGNILWIMEAIDTLQSTKSGTAKEDCTGDYRHIQTNTSQLYTLTHGAGLTIQE